MYLLIEQDINHYASKYMITEKGVEIFRLLINRYVQSRFR